VADRAQLVHLGGRLACIALSQDDVMG
jgi:hypothetical protein